jgi:hypothetical protein
MNTTHCMNPLKVEANGQSTPDSSGKEGRQEEQGQEYLQQQACAGTGSTERKRSRIIYIENSTNVNKPFVVEEVGTVAELIEKVCERFPAICLDAIGMKISNARIATLHRQLFTDTIPYMYDTLYITLFLRKHPV